MSIYEYIFFFSFFNFFCNYNIDVEYLLNLLMTNFYRKTCLTTFCFYVQGFYVLYKINILSSHFLISEEKKFL